MNRAAEFLREAGLFYLATCDGDKPRVRPMSGVFEFDGGVYLCLSRDADGFDEIAKNPNVEIAASNADGEWIRLSARAEADERPEAKESALDQSQFLRRLHTVDDENLAVLRLCGARARIVGGLSVEEFEF